MQLIINKPSVSPGPVLVSGVFAAGVVGEVFAVTAREEADEEAVELVVDFCLDTELVRVDFFWMATAFLDETCDLLILGAAGAETLS